MASRAERKARRTTRLYSGANPALESIRKVTVANRKQGGKSSAKEMQQRMAKAQKKARRASVMLQKQGPRMEWSQEVGQHDMIKLETLTVESLVENLRQRYDAERYYTYCGSILVALNPYHSLRETYYTFSIMQQYKNQRLGELPPHVFAIADAAFRDLMGTNRSVSVVISGESGAGKTETTKLILNYVSGLNAEPTEVEAKLIESASMLEAFGNAKTVRNNNSSRFGKLIKILFGKDHRIKGAEIETYLLEKSRISGQDSDERNYHIFYQLTEGATPEDRKRYQLKRAKDYRFINQCIDLGMDEAEELRATREGLSLFGFTDEEQHFIMSVIAAILHMGNIEFDYDAARQRASIATQQPLDIAAQLLQLPAPALGKVLVERTIKIRGQVIKKGLTAEEAAATRNAMCRTIYSAVFDWIVKRLNEGLKPATSVAPNFLGVLDIFGFENFKHNSFEQLLINYANEKLHQLFLEHVFKLEQQEYASEGIKWEKVNAADNAECISLVESKLGVLSLLDEESRLQSGSDDSFLKKLNNNHSNNKHYAQARLNPKCFVVKHYAEDVMYDSVGFRDKNQNTLADDVGEVIRKSKLPQIAEVFGAPSAAEEPKKGGGKRGGQRGANSVSSIFKKQLIQLKDTLDSTKPYFVRCIKSNTVQKPHHFEEPMVKSQLAYSGMVETVKIRRLGYPHRWDFKQFYAQYKPIDGLRGASKKEVMQFLSGTKVVPKSAWQVGKSKVFFKSTAYDRIEKARAVALQEVVARLQAFGRMIIARRHFQDVQWASAVIGRSYRVVLNNRRLQKCVVAALACAKMCRRLREEERERQRRAEEERRRKEEEARKRKAAARKKKEELRRKREAEKAAAAEKEKAERERQEKRAAAKRERARARKEAAERKSATTSSPSATSSRSQRSRSARRGGANSNAAKAEFGVEGEDNNNNDSASDYDGDDFDAFDEEAATEKLRSKAARLKAKARNSPAVSRAAKADAERSSGGMLSKYGSRASYRPSASRAPPPRDSNAPPARQPKLSPEEQADQAYIQEVKDIAVGTDPLEMIRTAKALQRKVRGQRPMVADALYEKAVQLYTAALKQAESSDSYINCGTAIINWGNLRFVMPQYPSKARVCMPLIAQATQMLDKAMEMGLDDEGRKAIQIRLKKCDELQDKALAADIAYAGPEHKAKLIAEIQQKLDALQPVAKAGKAKKQGAGNSTFGSRAWRDRLFILNETHLTYYAKSTGEKPKGAIALRDITAVKPCAIDGKRYAFAITTSDRFYPLVCKDDTELKEWVQAIQSNVDRVKLIDKLERIKAL